MARTNVKRASVHTHEGAVAKHINPMQQLRRSVMACMLWESEFYEDGQEIGDRITSLVAQLCKEGKAKEVQALAIEARTKMKLRHAPLHICVALARAHALRASTLAGVIERADELAEFLAMYWKGGKKPLSKQVKLGLAWAFRKFDAYALGKYNRDGQVKLRDVLFLVHAKPKDEAQAELWKKLAEGTLESPDTWEVALSAGADKKETFERLMAEKKLFALAFLRNLRNMEEAGVPKATIRKYAAGLDIARVLPFRFIAAARAVPGWEDAIEPLMLKAIAEQPKLPGKTVLLVDVSGSMDAPMSAKSDLWRVDAAAGLAILCASVCEEVEIYSFSNQTVKVPNRRGFALADAIRTSQPHSGTMLGQAVSDVRGRYDRLIVLTDEQSHDKVSDPVGEGYMINVASNRHGVGYGAWTHLDGFSEAVLSYIMQAEQG